MARCREKKAGKKEKNAKKHRGQDPKALKDGER